MLSRVQCGVALGCHTCHVESSRRTRRAGSSGLLDILDGGDADGANAKERRRRRNAPRVKEALDTLLALAPESLAQQNADTGDLADAQAAVTEVLNEGVRFVQTKWLKP